MSKSMRIKNCFFLNTFVVGLLFLVLLSSCGDKKEIINSIGQKFVLIPAGNFMMGSPPSEADRRANERQHSVTISRAFYMQTTEVTQGQWRAVMGSNPSFSSCGDNCPVEQVSWDDAQEFIRRLNQKEGTDKYRLPTEAEWEYACRAGSTTAWCFGDDERQLGEYAWYKDNYKDNHVERMHPVASRRPNVWGLYDMHGNVGEWCQDFYGDYTSGSVTNPSGPSSGKMRVARGGCLACKPADLRSARREKGPPDTRSNIVGFRVSRVL